jgi:hypothetical protein
MERLTNFEVVLVIASIISYIYGIIVFFKNIR